MATCRECKLFDLDACKDKAGRVRKDRAGKCNWVSKEQWPLSVDTYTARLCATYMRPDEGFGCPCFIRREA